MLGAGICECLADMYTRHLYAPQRNYLEVSGTRSSHQNFMIQSQQHRLPTFVELPFARFWVAISLSLVANASAVHRRCTRSALVHRDVHRLAWGRSDGDEAVPTHHPLVAIGPVTKPGGDVEPEEPEGPAELAALIATAARELDLHVNDAGLCLVCHRVWPCERATTAAFALSGL